MANNSFSNFTANLERVKFQLDVLFRIPLKEDAEAVLKKMKLMNNDTYKDGLGDLDNKLLEILKNDPYYFKKNFKLLPDGSKAVQSLFEITEDNKKNPGFRDVKRNAEVIKKYEKYVTSLKSVDELDAIFLKCLDRLHSEYKSSSDYMGRLVKRLLKYNFNYTDEDLGDTETRVLILRQLLNAFGYDCVEAISSPGLEDIVKKEFEGKVENITDDIFIHSSGADNASGYNEEYIDALVELQGTIIYKGSTISMTKELCEKLCELIHEETTVSVKSKKTNQPERVHKTVLTDSAKNGTAKLLKDCFCEPEAFLLDYVKNYKNAEISKIVDLVQNFKTLYASGKKKIPDSFADIDESIRLGILFGSFPDKIEATEKNIGLFEAAFPKMGLFNGRTFKECVSEADIKTIKCIKQGNIIKNQKTLVSIRELLAECEKSLDAGSKKEYKALIYKKIGERYNGATKPSKKDNLYSKIKSMLGGKAEHKLLTIADDLANARFSTQGKTREYLYIFAIAFGMTSEGYDAESDSLSDEITKMKNIKLDPRKYTDIQKNLFFDYYSDNIINNLDAVEGFGGKKSAKAVDGYGINYKNFAEITFLWCIAQKSLSAEEKLKLAYEIIGYCKANGKTEEEFQKSKPKSNKSKVTQLYKKDYENIGIKIKDKTKFLEFLIDNYPCKNNSSITSVNGASLSAGKELEKLQKRVRALLTRVEEEMFQSWESDETLDILLEEGTENNDVANLYIYRHYLRDSKCKNCTRKKGGVFPNCYAFFDKYSWVDDDGKEHKISSCKDYCAHISCSRETLRKSLKDILYIGNDCEGDFEKRLSSLSNLCNKNQTNLKNVLTEIEKRLNITALLGDINVSRSALIALCYFEMVLMNCLHRSFAGFMDEDVEVKTSAGDINDDIAINTFEEFYNIFCNGRTFAINYMADTYAKEDGYDVTDTIDEFVFPGANNILQAAGYQPINSKNIYDIYVIFLAFKDNYKKMFEFPDAKELTDLANAAIEKLELMKKEIDKNRQQENDLSKER